MVRTLPLIDKVHGTLSKNIDECFPAKIKDFLRKTPRPTGKAGRYDCSLADGELLCHLHPPFLTGWENASICSR